MHHFSSLDNLGECKRNAVEILPCVNKKHVIMIIIMAFYEAMVSAVEMLLW